jgi:hypothetical protein
MEPTVTKVWVDDTQVYIQTEDGKIFSEKFDDYYRLRNATPEQRRNFAVSHFGIHWEEIDEDLSFSGFMNKPDVNKNAIYKAFSSNPELNVSSVARRMGIRQSLMAAYLGGAKKPSKARNRQIEKTLHEIGKSLLAVKLS